MRNGKLKGSTVGYKDGYYPIGIWGGHEYGRAAGVKATYSTIQECICHVDPILMDEIYVKADCREDVWFFNNYIFDDTYMGRWIMYSELNNEKYYG